MPLTIFSNPLKVFQAAIVMRGNWIVLQYLLWSIIAR
jgi:hypothetical protein